MSFINQIKKARDEAIGIACMAVVGAVIAPVAITHLAVDVIVNKPDTGKGNSVSEMYDNALQKSYEWGKENAGLIQNVTKRVLNLPVPGAD